MKQDKAIVMEGEHSSLTQASKYFIYNTNQEERNGFRNEMVAIVKETGDAYGVSKILIEEGIFSMISTSLGPNIFLLEETNEGDLELLLNDAGVWKNRWFKEVREWRKTDVECYRAIWISIYGIPCFIRNKKFCEALISDIGIMANNKSLEEKALRLDVTKIMVLTEKTIPISKTIRVSVDGEWHTILLVKDTYVTSENREKLYSESEFTSEESEEGGGSL